MNFRAIKSLTFLIGLVLFIGAFVVIVMAGNLFNPAPYRIVVAGEDIPMYSTLTPDMLAVDEQTMNPKIARQLIHEHELDNYLGGTIVEPIHAGEPLRLMAIVASDTPGAENRLSLALDDPSKVAMVIPVSPDIIPDNIIAGDYVNIQMGVGQIQQMDTFAGADPVAKNEDVALPFAKIVLQNIPILQAQHEQIPNPNYGSGYDDTTAASEAPYIDGELERITVLIPKEAQELLAFSIENGALRFSLVPLIAVKDNLPQPTDGVTWEDFLAFFKAQREAGRNIVAPTPQTPLLKGTSSLTASTNISATGALSESQESTLAPQSLAGVPVQATQEAVASSGAGVISTNETNGGDPSGFSASTDFNTVDISGFILPGILCLISIIILVGGAIMFRASRKKKGAA